MTDSNMEVEASPLNASSDSHDNSNMEVEASPLNASSDSHDDSNINNIFSLETGQIAALSDAHHDFGNLYKREYVINELPYIYPTSDINHLSEDNFLKKYLLSSANTAEILKIKLDISLNTNGTIPDNIFNTDINNEYEVIYFRNNKINDNDDSDDTIDPSSKSFLQEILNNKGINNDVFIICDVAYSWIRNDLKKATSTDNKQIFWWTQTIETGFDPAGKTAWHTLPEFRKAWNTNSSLRFCWQAITESDRPNKLYIPWPEGKDKISNITEQNAMMCINKKILMLCKTDNIYNYKNYSSYLLVHDENNKKYVYANKDMSAKNYKMGKQQLSQFKNLAKNLISTYLNIFKSDTSSLPLLDNYTIRYQMLAKRFGDMPQALACIDNNLRFQTFINPTLSDSALGVFQEKNIGFPLYENFKQNRSIIKDNEINTEGSSGGIFKGGIFKTNGNNMFVSYDRIAVTQAINYRVPIVFYDQPFGFVLFIKKSLLNETNKLKQIFYEVNDDNTEDFWIFQDPKSSEKTKFILNKTIETNIDSDKIKTINEQLQFINKNIYLIFKAKARLSELFGNYKIEYDKEWGFREFLMTYFTNLVKMNMVIELNVIINFSHWVKKINFEFNELIKELIEEKSPQDFILINSENFYYNTQFIKDIIENCFSKLKKPEEVNLLNDPNFQKFIENIKKINNYVTTVINKINNYSNSINIFGNILIKDLLKDEIEKKIQEKMVLSDYRDFYEKYKDSNKLYLNIHYFILNSIYESRYNEETKKWQPNPPKGIAEHIKDIELNVDHMNKYSERSLESNFKNENLIFGILENIYKKENIIRPIYDTLKNFDNIFPALTSITFSSNFSGKVLEYCHEMYGKISEENMPVLKEVTKVAYEDLKTLLNNNIELKGGARVKRKKTVQYLNFDSIESFKKHFKPCIEKEIIIFNELSMLEEYEDDLDYLKRIIELDIILKNIYNIYQSQFINNISQFPNIWKKIQENTDEDHPIRAKFLLGSPNKNNSEFTDNSNFDIKYSINISGYRLRTNIDKLNNIFNNNIYWNCVDNYENIYNLLLKIHIYIYNHYNNELQQKIQVESQEENEYLFNPLENQIINSKIKINNINIIKILYYSINKIGYPGLILYPNEHNNIKDFNIYLLNPLITFFNSYEKNIYSRLSFYNKYIYNILQYEYEKMKQLQKQLRNKTEKEEEYKLARLRDGSLKRIRTGGTRKKKNKKKNNKTIKNKKKNNKTIKNKKINKKIKNNNKTMNPKKYKNKKITLKRK